MSRITWFKVGAVGALWTVIAVAAFSGWLIGHGGAAQQISDLRQRLAVNSTPKQSCGVEIELLEARAGTPTPTNLLGVALGGFPPKAPHNLYLREVPTTH